MCFRILIVCEASPIDVDKPSIECRVCSQSRSSQKRPSLVIRNLPDASHVWRVAKPRPVGPRLGLSRESSFTALGQDQIQQTRSV